MEEKTDWYEAIAKRSKCDKEIVRDVLARNSIRPSPIMNAPRRLHFSRVYFKGEKRGIHQGPFQFEWSGLKTGMWALVSDRNLRGKSTVLEIMKWLLRGKPSSKLQDGVRSWVTEAQIEFVIDSCGYSVELSQTEMTISGALLREPGTGKQVEVGRFDSDDTFESCMSSFMMKELSLDLLTAWRSPGEDEEVGKAVIHDWPALSGALFVGTDYSALFGEVLYDGLNLGLMQMYLGMPWVPTLSMLRTIDKQMRAQDEMRTRQTNAETRRRTARQKEVESELSGLRNKLAQMPSDESVRRALGKERSRHQDILNAMRQGDEELRVAEQIFSDAERSSKEDERARQDFVEDRAAHAVFRRLEPNCCPHCETAIGLERKNREKEEHTCSICGQPLLESEDAEAIMKELDARFKASGRAAKEARNHLLALKKQSMEQENEYRECEAELRKLENLLVSFEERHEMEKGIAALEAVLAEYVRSQDSKGGETVSKVDQGIIRAALSETKERVAKIQEGLLKDVSEHITGLSKRFGMTSVNSVRLTGNPQLMIDKDGLETSYSKCTHGEKLRLKVATIIAMMYVAEKRGVGRHPGVLLIDSPGAEEVVQQDIDQLLKGLGDLSTDLPHLQSIIATTSSESVYRYLPAEQVVHARDEAFLW